MGIMEKKMDLKTVLETLIFVAGRPLGTSEMMEALHAIPEGPQPTKKELEEALENLQREWEERGGAISLNHVAQGYEFRTLPEIAPWIRQLTQNKPHRLSMSAVETMALVAYRQPITRGEIENVRGVDSGGVLKGLMERRLIRVIGRKEEPGRPLLYATTKEFLEIFGLKDLDDLPPLQEFEEMIKNQISETAPGTTGISVEDLVSTSEELAELEEGDREALEDLDQQLKNLKDVEKTVLESTQENTPSEEETDETL